MHASATNFFDILQFQGKYQHQPPFPWVGGMEFAGVVLAVPSGNHAPKYPVGSKVFGANQGAYATRVCALENSLFPQPEGWSSAEAAGLLYVLPQRSCAYPWALR